MIPIPKTRNPNGMGSIKKRSDNRYEWRQMQNGIVRSVTATTPTELTKKIKQVSNSPVVKENLTTAEWFERWLSDYVKPYRKPATYDQYRILYQKHIAPQIGSYKLTGVQRFDVMKIIGNMNAKNLSASTMGHVRKVMHIAFNVAMQEKLITDNPVTDIDIPSKQKKQQKVLTVSEISDLLNAMRNSRWLISVKFLLVTALRRGELLALEWSDINTTERTMTINKSLTEYGTGDTKSSKARTVPLSDKAIELLREQQDMLVSEYPTKYRKMPELVFPARRGDYIKPHTYMTTIIRFAAKAGIHASPHSLRHTFVYLTRKQLSLKEIQAILGHEKSTTTLDIYGDILDSAPETAKIIDTVYDKILDTPQEVTDNVTKFRKVK